MDYFKKIERSVTISADKRSTVDLQVDVWSQDLNVTKFILKLDTTDSAAINLTNATVRVAMVYNQDGQDVKIEEAGIVEDVATQKIAYVMGNRLAGFEGMVKAGFYVTLNTGQRIDIQNVAFNMRKSLLDKDLEAATESYYQTFEDIVADVQSEGEKAKTNINAIVSDVQSVGDTAKEDIKATLPTLQGQVSQLFESVTEISDELNNLIVTEFPQKESTRDKWNFYIINHTFETDSKIVISTSGVNYGINYTKNGEYINVADYGITNDTVITVSKGDRIDVIQVVTFGSCTISCKVCGDKVKRETIPDGLIIHNYGTIVKQYYYGLRYNPQFWGGHFRTDNTYFITNPLPIIKDKDIYIDSTYTAHVLFYDESGEYLGYKVLYYSKPLLYSDIPKKAYYICFSVLKNSPDIENGDTAKLNTNTFDNRYMRRTVSERNYMEGTRLKTYIYNTDSIETIVHKMNEALATENVDVYWEYGNYNLNGLYDVLNNLYRFAGATPRGIYIGGNCRYYFNNALLTKDMSDVPSGNNYSSDILEGVTSNVASNCDYEIYDLNIHGTGIIYCIHDDVGTSTTIPTYRKYVNCKMRYTATESSQYLSKCIGGGTGRTTYREIDNCSFFMDGESPAISMSICQEVSFHGSKGDTEEGYFQLKVHDCFFEHSIGQHGLDTNQKADFYMSNCSLNNYTAPSDERWKSYVWNNEIRG